MKKKWCFQKIGLPVTSTSIVLLLVLSVLVAQEAFCGMQGRSRSRRDTGSNPLPSSAINLQEIHFKIVYETYRQTEGKNNWELYLINADGSDPVNLTNTADVNEFYPHASPEWSKICFVADVGTGRNKSRNVYYMNIDGTGRTKVVDNARQPCWSSDGKAIAYLKGEYSRYNVSSSANRGLYIYNLESKEHKQVPNNNLRHLFNLCWSPDQKWFVATSRGGRSGNIVIPADGSRDFSLGIRGCRPDISPDGRKLVWGRTDYDLQIGNLDLSSRRSNVTKVETKISCRRGYKVYHVDWSPDGKYLTFSYGSSRGSQAVGSRASGWNICICEIATGKWVQVTTDGNHNKEPDWVLVKPQKHPEQNQK
ncbi:MAG: hypothetical protein GY869_05135 [Planctomycetes bacterium]|nr:hypothetical protein [Planctomycetota bacterium]